MSESKQLRVGLDTSNLENNFQRIQSRADELAREMIRNSRSMSTSSKEVLKDLDDQIRKLEKISKLYQETEKFKIAEKFEAGAISEKQRESQLSDLKTDQIEDKMTHELLKSLIEEQRNLASEQVRQDREAVERKLQESRTVGVLSPTGDEYQNLIETIQKGMFPDQPVPAQDPGQLQPGVQFRPGRFGLGQAVSDPIGTGIMFGGQTIQQSTKGTDLATAGIIGYLIAQFGTELFNRVEDFGRAAAINVGQSGMRRRDWESVAIKNDVTDYGYTGIDFLEQMTAINRARGSVDYSGSRTRESLMMQRGLGLEQGQITSVEQILRGTDISTRSVTQDVVRSMRAAGIISATSDDMTLLPEMLQTLVSVSQQQLNTLGEIDIGMNIRMISAIANLDESFKNPQILGNVVASLRSGLQQSSTPQQQALQYSVLSQIGDLSMFQMEKLREDPFGEESAEYLPRYLEALNQMSMGNQEMFYFNIMEQFGVGAKMAERIGGGFLGMGREGFQEMIRSGALDEFMGVSVDGRAQEATTIGMATGAKTDFLLQQGIDEMKNFFPEALDLLKQMVVDKEKADAGLSAAADAFNSVGNPMMATLTRLIKFLNERVR